MMMIVIQVALILIHHQVMIVMMILYLKEIQVVLNHPMKNLIEYQPLRLDASIVLVN